MAINTYATLKTSIAAWIGGADSQTAATLGISTAIDDIVTLGESRIFRETRTKDTEFALNSNGIVPSDYVALKFAYLDGARATVLERRTLEWIYSNYPTRSAEGTPKYIGREGLNFVFGPFANAATLIKGVYYRRLLPLSTAVHGLFLNNPDLYLFACLAEAEILVGEDSRIKLWEAKYQKILMDVNLFDKQENASGSSLQMRVG